MSRAPITVWFIMVNRPGVGWTRVGTWYLKKETATGWRSFVRNCWHGLPTRVSSCRIEFNSDGTINDRTRKRLDVKYNCDARGTVSEELKP